MYYFTFGQSEQFPFQNGWVTVDADTREEACRIFRQYYPNPVHEELINCAFIYDEESFKHTSMYRKDNLGARCHRELPDSDTLTKLNIETLVIESTRRCNMSCEHCLRGDAENKDITFDTIRPLLKRTNSISTITFSGGEPALNPDIMRETLQYVKEHDIPVFGIYIATNGKVVPDEFLHLIIDWYVYVMECGGEPECSGLALSKDEFHEEIPRVNEYKLRALSFFSEDKITNFMEKQRSLIPKGRAVDLASYRFRDYDPPTDLSSFVEYHPEKNIIDLYDDLLYVTVHGNILTDCDYEYDEEEDLALGNTRNMPAFFTMLHDHIKSLSDE